jgi:hypothetical protein
MSIDDVDSEAIEILSPRRVDVRHVELGDTYDPEHPEPEPLPDTDGYWAALRDKIRGDQP